MYPGQEKGVSLRVKTAARDGCSAVIRAVERNNNRENIDFYSTLLDEHNDLMNIILESLRHDNKEVVLDFMWDNGTVPVVYYSGLLLVNVNRQNLRKVRTSS